MIKILSNEPNTVFYKDVKVGESFIYPVLKDSIYVKTRKISYTAHNNQTYVASCINIVTGEIVNFYDEEEVCLVDATVKWEYK